MNAEPFYVMCGIHRVSVVTHADYRALEGDHAELRIAYDAEYKRALKLEEELAALRGKTAELVASVEAHEYERVTGSARWNTWAASQKDGHLDRMTDTQERRRLALEALK